MDRILQQVKEAKRKLYSILLEVQNKKNEGVYFITDNELDIMMLLLKDSDIQEIIESAEKRGSQHQEEKHG